ncbi:MAG: hypothetical protein EA397_10740 [Deltaproteobacteria bacterium]|nr:MAG: hypothetical protein EA397_10740 [Deltaproteobacteria bacterium]
MAGPDPVCPISFAGRWCQLPSAEPFDGTVVRACDALAAGPPPGPVLLLAEGEPPPKLPPRVTVAPSGPWSQVVADAWIERLIVAKKVEKHLRHDIYSPLGVLVGHIDLLQEPSRGPLSAPHRSSILAMQRALDRLEDQLDALVRLLESHEGLWARRPPHRVKTSRGEDA